MTPERLREIREIWEYLDPIPRELIAALEEAWAEIEKLKPQPRYYSVWDDDAKRLIRYYAGKDILDEIENDRDGVL